MVAHRPCWNELITDFLIWVKGSNRAATTVRYYDSRLRGLARWCAEQNIQPWEFAERHLRLYISARTDQGVSEATRSHDQIAAKCLFRHAANEWPQVFAKSPLEKVKVRKPAERYREHASDEEVKALFDAIAKRWSSNNPGIGRFQPRERRFYCARDRALIGMLMCTGMRPDEMLRLTPDDIDRTDPNKPFVIIREAKGRRPRTIPLQPEMDDIIRTWQGVRGDCETRELFRSVFDEPLTGRRLRRIIDSYLENSGVQKRVTARVLRRYFLTAVVAEDFWAAVQIAGHRDPKTTMTYLAPTPEAVRTASLAANPLRRSTARVKKL